MKKITKLAVLRDNDTNPCPFGLFIPFACKNAGNAVDEMIPLNGNKNEEIAKANLEILKRSKNNSRCIYASHTFSDKIKSVDCSFNDPANAEQPLNSTPFYENMYGFIPEMGMQGLYTSPLEYYSGSISSEPGAITNNPYNTTYQSASNKSEKMKIRAFLFKSLLKKPE